MKIYTKTGDSGETGLLGGKRVGKDHLVVEVCGTLDELNCLIGLARSQALHSEIDSLLCRIQSHLFDLGSRVAGSLSDSSKVALFPAERSTDLERAIDQFQQQLPPLTAFVLPGGSVPGSYLHLARAVCRRGERRMYTMIQTELDRDLQPELVYMNRLSDLLFVVARLANIQSEIPEVNWQPDC